jgi:hypothetical protein
MGNFQEKREEEMDRFKVAMDFWDTAFRENYFKSQV